MRTKLLIVVLTFPFSEIAFYVAWTVPGSPRSIRNGGQC